ncbi:hypothetical protein PDENDC454_02140 [Paenibacillus dendritiformis C454]|uniref:Uncharacterized protein n=1 Tax=Paenibacillus dendritiformis C454 TaxID=1131935 RepID=H3SA95_9BACL|nr:hypothetical protein PDENDC454_02140 [Paenibacillus dendritiformis C454]
MQFFGKSSVENQEGCLTVAIYYFGDTPFVIRSSRVFWLALFFGRFMMAVAGRSWNPCGNDRQINDHKEDE